MHGKRKKKKKKNATDTSTHTLKHTHNNKCNLIEADLAIRSNICRTKREKVKEEMLCRCLHPPNIKTWQFCGSRAVETRGAAAGFGAGE